MQGDEPRDQANDAPDEFPGAEPGPPIPAHAGGYRELLVLAWPLVLSSSFWAIQLFIDGVFLTWYDPKAVAAIFGAAVLFWTPFILFQTTANYATTFVAQYVGAGRPERVGPAVWQSLYFSLAGGIAFLAFLPLAPWLISLGSHSEVIQGLELSYFECLCWSAPPLLIVASATSFFTGLGDSWTVLIINAAGFAVNALLD